MKEITVKRIIPEELPTPLCYRLNYIYHTELGNFKVMCDDKERVMYVNREIPEDDIQMFVRYVSYAGDCINSEKSEGGLLELSDCIIDRYGNHTWHALYDAYRYRKKETEMARAEVQARELLRLITSFDESEELSDLFNDYLAYHISMAGDKTKRKTLNNMVGYGTKYVFWLGYLEGRKSAVGGKGEKI